MKNYKTLLLFSLLISTFSQAQNTNKVIDAFQKKTEASITINENSRVPEFIKFSNNKPLTLNGQTIQEKALSFLNKNKSLYKIEDVDNGFKLGKHEVDDIGFQRIVLNQQYSGVPVFDGKLLFHFNNDKKLTAINGNYIIDIKLNAVPTISKNEANTIAINLIASQGLNNSGVALFSNESKLFIFQKGLVQGYKGPNYLVYKVEVINDNDVREFVFVNAHNGTIVEQFTGMAHALNRVVYENNVGNVVWQEGDALPGNLSIWQQNEVIASGHAYHFFNNAFGFTSYNGADAQMRTINNNPNISCPNANWNGSTVNYCDGTASDDVIAHEWGHAYTEYTSNLIYAWQSGAINEAYSDIWGETIDLLNNYQDEGEDNSIRTSSNCNSSNRWRMGEDASAFGSNIRDMWNPNCEGDPAKVTDGSYSCGEFDSGGVHINSGIPNRAYSLLVDGGTFNGQTVAALGFTKSAHIFWRAGSQYLTATSDFNDLANALEASANDLIGVNLEGLSTTATPAGPSSEIISALDVQQVVKAVLAVEMRVNPDVCGYTSIIGQAPEMCEVGMENPIYFEDWETGTDGWNFSQVPTGANWTPRNWVLETNLPSDRVGQGVFAVNAPIGVLYGGNCSTDFQNGIMRLESPEITFPDFTDGTYELAINHYIATEPNWDGTNIKYSINNGTWVILPQSAFIHNGYNGVIYSTTQGNDNPMQGQIAFTGADEGANRGSWGTSVIDLSSIGALANNSIKFRFDLGVDGCNGREGWYIDEVTVYNCAYSLSVSEFEIINNMVSVYPNPSNGVFNLKKTGPIDLINAEIHDINGRFIKAINLQQVNTEMTVDLSNAASGLYFMTIKSKDAERVIKLMKQ